MVDSPAQARNKLARAHIGGAPDPEAEVELRHNLAFSNCYKAITDTLFEGYPLDDMRIGLLISHVLNQSGVAGQTSTRCEEYVRGAVRESRAARAER